MNKQEAADFLGVSVRALERYVQQGRVSVRYEKGKTRPTARFDPTELEALKAELNQSSYKPAIESHQTQEDESSPVEPPKSRQIATASSNWEDTGLVQADIGVIERLSGVIELLLKRGEAQPTVPIEAKILLTLSEAQALTGLSRQILLDAINQGKLNAKVIGKTWRIKRTDLDQYISTLF